MDFEVLATGDHEDAFWNEVVRFFREPRRQLQDWDAKPPYGFGVFVLLSVSIETVLTWRISSGRGLAWNFLSQIVSMAALLALALAALAKVGQEVATFFKKKGSFLTALTFFSIGLMPLLLILPVSFIQWTLPQLSTVTLLALLVLLSRVFFNFRESLEVVFELSRLQSAAVMYVSCLLVIGGIFVAAYVSVLGLLTDFISGL